MTALHAMLRTLLRRALPPLLALPLLLGALPPAAPGQEEQGPVDPHGRPLYVAGELLVEYRQGFGAQSLGASARSLVREGDAKLVAHARRRFQRVKVAPGHDVRAAARALRQDPAVTFAAPNYYNYLLETPNDDFWISDSMWGMENTGQELDPAVYSINNPGEGGSDVDAPAAWDDSKGDGIIIAIIDTGVDYDHEDLTANMWDGAAAQKCDDNQTPIHGCDFSGTGDNDPAPAACSDGWHGTHVAGTAAAEAGFSGPTAPGVPGMAPQAIIMALKVFDSSCRAPDSAIIDAIGYAAANGAKVANLSLGRYDDPNDPNDEDAMRSAIKSAIADHNVVFVAAAGNDNSNNDTLPIWPANFAADSDTTVADGVISVLASDQADVRGNFSNFGIGSVTIGAPGVNIVGPTPNDQYVIANGTSMAAPMVAGIAALVRDAMINLESNSNPTPKQIKTRIVQTGDPIEALSGCVTSTKRANAARAVSNGSSTTPLPYASDCPGGTTQTTTASTVPTSSSSGGCLITWATEDWLADGALAPLRRVRDWLWQQGEPGRTLVRGYYRLSATVLGWLAAPPHPALPAAAAAI